MQPTPRTPGFVIAAAVLLFIYGSSMLICSFCGIWQAIMLMGDPGPADLLAQEREVAKRIPSYMAVEAAAALYNLVLGATMILAGAGALRLSPFARVLGSGAACVDLCTMVVHGLYVVFVVFPVNNQIFAEQMQNNGMANVAQGISWFMIVFLSLFGLAFCVSILAFLNVAKSRNAFAGIFEPTAEEERMARLEALADDGGYHTSRPGSPSEPGSTGIKEKPE